MLRRCPVPSPSLCLSPSPHPLPLHLPVPSSPVPASPVPSSPAPASPVPSSFLWLSLGCSPPPTVNPEPTSLSRQEEVPRGGVIGERGRRLRGRRLLLDRPALNSAAVWPEPRNGRRPERKHGRLGACERICGLFARCGVHRVH